MSLFGKVLKVGKSLKGKTGIIKGIVGGLDKEEEKEKAKKKIKKIIIIILIVILVIAILGQGDIEERVNKGILPSSEDDKEYSEHCPAAYYKSIYITEQGTLMAEKSVQEMWDEDKNATGRTKLGYSTYLSSPDALAYLLNAQIVTQYPYIDSASGTDLNGTVRFYRNESKQPMAYLSQEALQKYVDDYNNKGDTDSLAKALDSFSINNDGTITVAYLEEDYETLTTNDPEAASTAARDRDASSNSSGNGTYIVETSSSQLFTTTVAYQSLVRKYTMPFELLWAIAVWAHNGGPITEDFCYAMATMAYDGEIRLIIDDSNTVTTTTDNYKYDKEKKTEYSDIVLYRNGASCARRSYTTDPEKVGNFWVTNVDVNTVNSPSLKIGLIQSWCALYNNDAVFTSEETQGTPEKNSSQPKKTDWEENGGVKNEWSYENCPIGGIKRMFSRYVSNSRQTTISGGTVNPGVTTTTESNSFKIVASGTNYKRYNNISQTTKVDTSTFSYTNGTVTSPAFNQDMADLINVSPYSATRKFLIRKSERANFMRIIEGNEATANMVDLLNYIFEKAEDPNYDEEGEEWNSIWEALYGGMDGFYGTSGLEGIEGEIFDAFLKNGFTPEGASAFMGNMYCETMSNFDPYTVEAAYTRYSGDALIQYEKDYTNKVDTGVISRNEFMHVAPIVTTLKGKRYEAKGYGLVGFTDPTLKGTLYDTAKAQGKSIGDASVQVDTIVNWINKSNKYLYEELKTSNDVDHLTKEVMLKFERPYDQSQSVIAERQKAARMFYEKYKTNSLSGGTASSNEIANKVIQLAKSKMGCPYTQGTGRKGPNSFDCSGLVWWCYKQVGIDIPGTTGEYMPAYSKYKIDLKDIQPGDILWRHTGGTNGHAALYIGNDKIIHAANPEKGVIEGSFSNYQKYNRNGGFKAAFRFWNK